MAIQIPARVSTDDGVFSEPFDAVAWFSHATDAEIRGLADVGWGGDYEADAVAELIAALGVQWATELGGEEADDLRDAAARLGRLFDYDQRQNVGFEVQVEEAAARTWIAANRPELSL